MCTVSVNKIAVPIQEHIHTLVPIIATSRWFDTVYNILTLVVPALFHVIWRRRPTMAPDAGWRGNYL